MQACGQDSSSSVRDSGNDGALVLKREVGVEATSNKDPNPTFTLGRRVSHSVSPYPNGVVRTTGFPIPLDAHCLRCAFKGGFAGGEAHTHTQPTRAKTNTPRRVGDGNRQPSR